MSFRITVKFADAAARRRFVRAFNKTGNWAPCTTTELANGTEISGDFAESVADFMNGGETAWNYTEVK